MTTNKAMPEGVEVTQAEMVRRHAAGVMRAFRVVRKLPALDAPTYDEFERLTLTPMIEGFIAALAALPAAGGVDGVAEQAARDGCEVPF